jgi:hypothetical protein
MSEPYRPDQSMQMRQEMRQQQIIGEILAMEQQTGMEVFFNIERLPQFTGQFIGHVASHPNETHVAAVIGRSGVGKYHAMQGIVMAALQSETLRQATEEAGAPLELMVLTLADQLAYTQGLGLTETTGGIELNTEWCHFSPRHFENATAQMDDNVGWAIHHREPGERVTRVLVLETLGMVDPDPLLPPPVGYNPADPNTLIKLNLGGTVIARLGRYDNAHAFAIPESGVQAVSAVNREAVERFQSRKGLIVDVGVNSPLLQPTNARLDQVVSASRFYRSGGNRYAMERTNGAFNKNQCIMSARERNVILTPAQLAQNPDLRKDTETWYFTRGFERWGWHPSRYDVGANPVMFDESEDSENEAMHLLPRTQMIGLMDQHQFPYDKVPRNYNMQQRIQRVGNLAIAQMTALLAHFPGRK